MDPRKPIGKSASYELICYTLRLLHKSRGNSCAAFNRTTGILKVIFEEWQKYQNRFVVLSMFMKDASSRHSSLFLSCALSYGTSNFQRSTYWSIQMVLLRLTTKVTSKNFPKTGMIAKCTHRILDDQP